MYKTILILANSIRNDPNRCIAGRRAKHDAKTDSWDFGQWIRPVSKQRDGEVSPLESQCDDGSPPAILDLVAVPLAEKANIPYQPENYFLDKGTWRKRGQFTDDLSGLIETPKDLWIELGMPTDRVSEKRLATMLDIQSLYLIRPQNLYFEIWRETNQFDGHRQNRRRACFDYNGLHYNLPVTDPSMDKRYFLPFPELDKGSKKIVPDKKTDFLLTVSLGAKFEKDGNHYKLVATVIET
jgi:hypothetical protein